MALQRQMSVKNEPASPTSDSYSEDWGSMPTDFLSEESDFYGSPKAVSTYNKRVDSYNPEQYWEVHERNAQAIAVKGKKAAKKAAKQRARELEAKKAREDAKRIKLEEPDDDSNHNPKDTGGSLDPDDADPMDLDLIPPVDTNSGTTDKRKPVNYYEGRPTAKQLSEPITEFLSRIAPSSTPRSEAPWIWIANPYPQVSSQLDSGDIGGFKQTGFNLLEDYTTRKEEVEKKNPGKPPGTITRLLRGERLKLESALLTLAREKHVMNGKWMLFPPVQDVDRVWRIVAKATWEGKLGIAAKVATNAEDEEKSERSAQRLICIYTHDFSDQDDVTRVVRSMRKLSLLDEQGDDQPVAATAIYYKCDAYTHLDIMSGNEFKLKASMYSSRDLLKNQRQRRGE